jgi:hypothetical protein
MRSKGFFWLITVAGIIALVVWQSLVVIVALGLLLGGPAFGVAVLVVSLTVGSDGASKYEVAYIMPPVLSVLIVAVHAIRLGIGLVRTRYFPSIWEVAAEAVRHLLTFHLALQISLGATVATAAILLARGDSTMDPTHSNMDPTQPLVVALFSIIVFIISATFSSYFMRSLIPWRKEHPYFSDAIAYTVSTLLGLIAAIYAVAGKDTVKDADHLGELLYQISVAVATIGATLVGAYVAILDKRAQASSEDHDKGNGSSAAG